MNRRSTLVDQPSLAIGTPTEYALWASRLRKYLSEMGADADDFEQVDARYNYKGNRITLYRLATPSDEGSVADTISHEFLHALLYQLGERGAARLIDLVGKQARNPERVGGI